MSHAEPLASRVNCPCCGFPTLSERAVYDICRLCNWEDDGQGDENADVIRGGPNGGYSLAEARLNFKKYRVMYAPGRDQRFTGSDTLLQYDLKGQLMQAFSNLLTAGESQRDAVEQEIVRLEDLLRAERKRKIREHEESL